MVEAAVPGFRWRLAARSGANITGDATRQRGAWGAYDITRLRTLGWAPRPLAEAIADYARWIIDHEGPITPPDPRAQGSGG